MAREAGIASKDDWEELQIDIIVDTLNDLRIGKFCTVLDWQIRIHQSRLTKTSIKKLEIHLCYKLTVITSTENVAINYIF